MKFNLKIEKASIINSQTVSAEDMGDWKASLNGTINIKDPQSMANFTSVTVYKVVTVLVRASENFCLECDQLWFFFTSIQQPETFYTLISFKFLNLD